MSPTIITSWLLTYLVHSTILLGAAWLVSRFLGESRLALQETLLRTAFAAGPRLDRRVRRLLEGGTAAKMTPARITPLVVCLLAAAAFTLPVVSSVPAHAELTRAGSDAASIKPWSDADEPTPEDAAQSQSERTIEETRNRRQELRTKAKELAWKAPHEAGERSRDLSEKARRLAEEAEVERRAEEERHRLEVIE